MAAARRRGGAGLLILSTAMFVLGHLGIGARLGARLLGPTPDRTLRWLALGTLLPDLIDKPLYYGLVLATGRRAAALGLISGTRTVGHTALFGALLFLFLTWGRRGAEGRALLVGLATHWLLDLGGDAAGVLLATLGLGGPRVEVGGPPTIAAILFPLLGAHFPVMPDKTVREHLLSLRSAYTLGGELVGGWLIFSWWRARRRLTRGAAPPGGPGR